MKINKKLQSYLSNPNEDIGSVITNRDEAGKLLITSPDLDLFFLGIALLGKFVIPNNSIDIRDIWDLFLSLNL